MKYMVIKNVGISSPMYKKVYKKDDIFTDEDFSVKDIKRLLFLKYIKVLSETKHTNNDSLNLSKLDYNFDNGNSVEDDITEDDEITSVKSNTNTSESPFYMMSEDYLNPEEVNKLDKAQLIEYCKHIGVTGYKPNSTLKHLRELINEFIESAN